MIRSDSLEWRKCACGRSFPADRNGDQKECPVCRMKKTKIKTSIQPR